MKSICFILLVLAFMNYGCGYSSRQNELTGQVKKVKNQTPIVCPERVDVDMSLGIMRNGVGSMSTEDVWLTVPDKGDQKILKDAATQGTPVKVTYDVARVTFCTEEHLVTHVEVLK